jgi:putative oxidoreductase
MQTIGKYVYAVPFLLFGINHFVAGSQMAGMVPVPGGVIWIYVTGAAMIAASISIFINKKTKLAMILLAVLLGIYIGLLHLPGAIKGDISSTINTLKDLGLLGGALVIAGISKDNA